MRHPVPDRRPGALQQLPVQRLEGGAGVGAELVPQRAAVGPVPGQRRRRPHRGRLAAQQLTQHLLVPRALGGQLGKLLGRLGVAAQPCQGQRAGPHQRPVGGRPFCAQRRQRVVHLGVAARGPLPQGQARLGVGQRRRVVAGPGAAGAGRGAEQDGGGVDLLLDQGEAVAGGGAGDDVGAQLRPGPGDQNLERLGRVLGLLLRPQALDQPGGAGAGTQVAGEQREQATQPAAGDLLAAPGHPRQQGQLGGHPTSLVVCYRSSCALHAAVGNCSWSSSRRSSCSRSARVNRQSNGTAACW